MSTTSRANRGRVIEFPSRALVPAPSTAPAVTQERLRKGAELLAQEWKIVREMRQFTMQLEADLAAGAQLEAGDFEYDRDLKMVRRTPSARTAVSLP